MRTASRTAGWNWRFLVFFVLIQLATQGVVELVRWQTGSQQVSSVIHLIGFLVGLSYLVVSILVTLVYTLTDRSNSRRRDRLQRRG